MSAVYLTTPDAGSVVFDLSTRKLTIVTRLSLTPANIHKIYNSSKSVEVKGNITSLLAVGDDTYELILPASPYISMSEDEDDFVITFLLDSNDIARQDSFRLPDAATGSFQVFATPLTVEYPLSKGLVLITADDINGTEGDETQLYLSLTGADSWADLRHIALAKNSALPATTIAVNAGNNQTADVETVLPIDPSVLVTNGLGQPVSGVSVTFAVTAGAGTIAIETAVLTNASGIATAGDWTLGAEAGANTLTATSAGLTGSPVTFTATAEAV